MFSTLVKGTYPNKTKMNWWQQSIRVKDVEVDLNEKLEED